MHSPVVLVTFMYGDCHGREAASRHRGSCLLLVMYGDCHGREAASRHRGSCLLLFFYMATAMAERQRRGIEALAYCFFMYGDCHGREAASQKLCSYATICGSPSICANQHSSPSSIFYSSISSFCNLCFHSLYLSQRQ